MNRRSLLNLIIGGGLIVLLFFLTSVKTRAVIGFKDGQYLIEKEKYLFEDLQKNTQIDSKLKLSEDWNIEEVINGDFDNDGLSDIAVYLWKVGNYGPSMPFWETENDNSYKQHLFLYSQNSNGEYSAKWQSSNLPYNNIKTILSDVDEDGLNELIVLEKPYNGRLTAVAVWQWDEWGFKNIWRSEASNFTDLRLK